MTNVTYTVYIKCIYYSNKNSITKLIDCKYVNATKKN